MELVIVLGISGREISVAYLGEHQTCYPRAWVQSALKCFLMSVYTMVKVINNFLNCQCST